LLLNGDIPSPRIHDHGSDVGGTAAVAPEAQVAEDAPPAVDGREVARQVASGAPATLAAQGDGRRGEAVDQVAQRLDSSVAHAPDDTATKALVLVLFF